MNTAKIDTLLHILKAYSRERMCYTPALCQFILCSERELRRMVAEARRNGYLIGSGQDENGGGYYMIRTADEAREVYERLFSHARSEIAALRSFRRRMKDMEEQEALL